MNKKKKKTDKYAELEEKYLRCMADLQNVRRRAQEDRVQLIKNGGEKVIERILPILDNFDRAVRALPKKLASDSWVQGILALEKMMFSSLAEDGLSIICDVNVPFDEKMHEAVATDKKTKGGIVSEVLDKGYILNGKVIRVAKVRVGA